MTAPFTFEALLAQAVKEQEDRKARDRVKRGQAGRGPSSSAASVKKDIEATKAFDDTYFWKDKALVASFHEQECKCCGEFSYAFTGWLLRKSHRSDKSQVRWVRIAEDEAQRILARGDLPKEMGHNSSQVPVCAECIDTQIDGCSWDNSYSFEEFSTLTSQPQTAKDHHAQTNQTADSEPSQARSGDDLPQEIEEPGLEPGGDEVDFSDATGEFTGSGGAGSAEGAPFDLGLDSSLSSFDDDGLDAMERRLGPAPF